VKLKEWREQYNKIDEWTLPSGLEVKTGPVDMLRLMASGNIPAPLLALMQELQGGGQPEFNAVENLSEMTTFIDAIVGACLLEPIPGEVSDDTHIVLSELPVGDRIAIFNRVMGGAASIAPFPAEPTSNVGSVPDRKSVRRRSKAHSRN
jgi:hypothetical protein